MRGLWCLNCGLSFSHPIRVLQEVLVQNCREFHALSEYIRILEYMEKKSSSSGFFKWIFLENIMILLKQFSLLKIKITKFLTHHSMQFDVLFHMRLNLHSPTSLMWPIGPRDWGPVFWARSIVWRIVFPTWDTFTTIKVQPIDYTIDGEKSFVAALIVVEKMKFYWKLSKWKKFDPVLLRVHISPEWIIRSSWNSQFLPNFIGAIYC